MACTKVDWGDPRALRALAEEQRTIADSFQDEISRVIMYRLAMDNEIRAYNAEREIARGRKVPVVTK